MSGFAVISENTAADHEIVAAVAGKKIKVTSYTLIGAGAVSVTWKSAAAALSGAMPLAANSQLTAHASGQRGVLETVAGEALNLTLSGGVLVAGHLTYELE
jgi:hypothetical protein